MLRDSGDGKQADQNLFCWIEAAPDDREVLYRMRDRFTSNSNGRRSGAT